MTVRIRLSILLCLAPAGATFAQTDLLDLEIGDLARREHEISIELDKITDTATNESVSPRSLAEELGRSRVVLVGEEHTGQEFHAIQLRVLELLHTAGAPLAVGLEMIPVDKQAALDAWIGGGLDEPGFLEMSDWYRVWGYNWGYYRDVFLFARQLTAPCTEDCRRDSSTRSSSRRQSATRQWRNAPWKRSMRVRIVRWCCWLEPVTCSMSSVSSHSYRRPSEALP